MNAVARRRSNAKKITHRALCRTSGMTREQAVIRRAELRRTIRICRAAVSGSLLGMSVPAWSPVRSWQNALKCPYNADKRKAEAELAALDDRFPSPEWWQPRKSTAADKRIAKQYKPAATFVNNRPRAYLPGRGIRTVAA